MNTDTDTNYRLLKILESRPDISQRALAAELGISLGKANYCLKALIDKGWVKARNFGKSNRKLSYAYVLTPSGIKRKAEITVAFLRRKQHEYAALEKEIAQLQTEVDDMRRSK